MSRFLAEDFRAIADRLDSIASESTMQDDSEIEDQLEEVDAPKKDDDEQLDPDVTDMMTKEKKPEKLSGAINVKGLAADLGIDNVTAFQAAFNSLRQGKMPSNQSQVRELAIAFDRLLAADASTTSRVLTKLRTIHKS